MNWTMIFSILFGALLLLPVVLFGACWIIGTYFDYRAKYIAKLTSAAGAMLQNAANEITGTKPKEEDEE